MKHTFGVLILILFLTYAKEGYRLITQDIRVKCALTRALSDVAEEVTAIPLETNANCMLGHATRIKREGNHLFLLSRYQLYHFDCSGHFINQITYNRNGDKNQIQATDYVIDPIRKQLIVKDNYQNVQYYNYEGEFLGKTRIPIESAWGPMGKLAYYNQQIWVTTDRLIRHPEQNNLLCIEQWLYTFDTTFQKSEARKLNTAELGRLTIDHAYNLEIAVANNHVYVQAPSLQPERLMEDTLYLIGRNKLAITENYSSILPWRIGSRFLVSSFHNPSEAEKGYIFCFDRETERAYHVRGGLTDNFYNTGKVTDLQVLDIHSNSYCYYKSSQEVQKTFPDRKNTDNPVLFIVRMKA